MQIGTITRLSPSVFEGGSRKGKCGKLGYPEAFKDYVFKVIGSRDNYVWGKVTECIVISPKGMIGSLCLLPDDLTEITNYVEKIMEHPAIELGE